MTGQSFKRVAERLHSCIALASLHTQTREEGEIVIAHFNALRRDARLRMLQMHYESGVGHIGGNLSALDILLYLHHHHMQDQDIFILSKGHAAGALYITLWTRGLLPEEELASFHRDNTRLSGHPPAKGFDENAFATGSLGHGFSLAAGMALGHRLNGNPGHVFCLLSDGELQEGSTLEAMCFASHHGLSNLTVLVDGNGLQGFGNTMEIASQTRERFAALCTAYGMNCTIADGHDALSLAAALDTPSGEKPRTIWCDTVKGAGVPFMENRMEWHYLPMSQEQYRTACAAVGERS